MEINGIKIRDIKDAQDILMALVTIKSGIENVSDDMSNNYNNYSSLNKDLSNNSLEQKNIIEAITTLQLKAHELLKNIDILNKNSKSISTRTIEAMKDGFNSFEYSIKEVLNNSINDIDLTTFTNQVNRLFANKISNLESEVNKLNKNNSRLKITNDSINDSINNFNKISKIVNWKVITSSVLSGMLMGGMLMGGFSISFLKDKMFKDEQIAIKNYNTKIQKMEAKYIAASEFEKVAREFEVKYTTDKDGNRYIIMPSKNVQNSYKSDGDYQVWKLY